MSDDKELIERVARVLATSNIASIYKRGATPSEADHYWPSFEHDAQAAIAAVRAYDTALAQLSGLRDSLMANFEVATSITDNFIVRVDGEAVTVTEVATAELYADPDDYRDPFSLVTKMSKAPGIKT
jgi:hypothetical protein